METQIIKRFKGMNRSRSATSLSPEWAMECLNVLPSTLAGTLDKMRLPVDLSSAIAGKGTGPDQFQLFENATGKQILAFFGVDIYRFTLDDYTAIPMDSNPAYANLMSVVQANNQSFFNNGVAEPLKFNGTDLDYWGIQTGQIPTLGVLIAGTLSLSTGRRYRVAYKNGTTGHVGTASAISASSGALINQQIPVTIPAPSVTDAQITAARVYATLDGGSDYFFERELTGAFPQTFNDQMADSALDQSERAPLINDRPPTAKYLTVWGARIFGFNIANDPQGIWYTGYNRILVGRPEESCPPGNRLRLAVGADDISGGGVIAQGIVAFDRSNKMFMFRGQPEDITYTAPVEFTLFLQQLPWSIGCASHFTIQSTPHGLAWLTPDRQIRLFDGTNYPQVISNGIEPIMRTLTLGQEFNARSAYWSYLDRNWYVLAIPTDGSTQLNLILVVDLEPDEETNVGIFAIDIGVFQSIGVIETAAGEQKLVIGQEGLLKELTVSMTTTNGINEAITSTDEELGAFWRSAYFGNEAPQLVKMMRFIRLIADNLGFQIKRYLVDDEAYPVTSPYIIEASAVDPTTATSTRFSTNLKTRRMSIEIRFPSTDVDCSVSELSNSYIPVAER